MALPFVSWEASSSASCVFSPCTAFPVLLYEPAIFLHLHNLLQSWLSVNYLRGLNRQRCSVPAARG